MTEESASAEVFRVLERACKMTFSSMEKGLSRGRACVFGRKRINDILYCFLLKGSKIEFYLKGRGELYRDWDTVTIKLSSMKFCRKSPNRKDIRHVSALRSSKTNP